MHTNTHPPGRSVCCSMLMCIISILIIHAALSLRSSIDLILIDIRVCVGVNWYERVLVSVVAPVVHLAHDSTLSAAAPQWLESLEPE
uniref:Putative secreted protein n=1 Tax=Anopheles darlingi TaxID=43151 RepID=A0A2M4D5J8_ANODA